MDDAQRAQLREQLRWLGWAAVAVLVGGLVAGWAFGLASPTRAADTVLMGFDTFEADVDTGEEVEDRLEGAPTSGRPRGVVRCGVRTSPVSLDDQRASVAAGRVVVQHGPAIDAERLAALVASVEAAPDAIVLAPAGHALVLDGDEVVVTAWLWRLGPQAVAAEVVDAFVTAHGGNGPRLDTACDEAPRP